jgi:hypothetical protein
MTMRKTLFAIVAIVAIATLLPVSAQAQRRINISCCKKNPFSFAPYAGAWKDALDISQDDDNTGYLIGFRTGYDLGRRSRLVADIAYGETHDIANTSGLLNYNVYNNEWIMTTGGVEYDIIPGPTSVTFAAQAGAGWRKVALDETVGVPQPQDQSTGFEAQLLLAPRVTVRHSFSARTALDVSVLDQIFPDDTVRHSPALTVGFIFR